MKINDILFYVLIPIYKTEESLPFCIDSVLKQDYQNFKIILVDDGSPDQAGAIADEYAKRDSRITVIHKENQGLISARRAAIDFVNANFDTENSFFMFLDSDDTYQHNALSVVRDTVLRENCDLVFFCLQRVCGENVLGHHEQDPFSGTIEEKRDLYKKVFFDWVYNPLCRKAIKAALVKSEDYSAFYHINAAEDLLQSIPVYRDCKKAVFITDVLYNYTLNPNSITQKVDPDKFKVITTIMAQVLKFLQNENVFTDADFSEYLDYCRCLMRYDVIKISLFKIPYKRIKGFLTELKKDPYYAMLLENASGYMLYFLKKGVYFPFVIPLRFRNWLVKIKYTIWRKNENR